MPNNMIENIQFKFLSEMTEQKAATNRINHSWWIALPKRWPILTLRWLWLYSLSQSLLEVNLMLFAFIEKHPFL